MSRGLGQTELLTPPATRRLIVRPGQTAWFGVDPSTVRVAIASVAADGARGVSTVPFAREESAKRLASIHHATRLLVTELVETVGAPGVVVVEQPSGKTPNLNLVYAVGVIVAACVSAAGCVVEMVTSSQWKALACGKGNIYKPQRVRGRPAPAPEDYPVLPWARSCGYVGASWDEADAWGVADYARRTFALEAR